MSTTLEDKMKRLEQRIKARTKPDGAPRRNYEQNVARLRAEMEIISGRIEYARSRSEEEDAGE